LKLNNELSYKNNSNQNGDTSNINLSVDLKYLSKKISNNNIISNEYDGNLKKLENNNKISKIIELKSDSTTKTIQKIEKKPFSYFTKIRQVFCNRKQNDNDEYKIFHILTSYINRRTDIICYLKYLDKFDIFKSLYLNETQQIAFDHFRKPDIYNKKVLEKINLKPLNIYSEEKEQIELYYLHAYKNEELTKKDELIFDNLPDKLKENIFKRLRKET